MMTDPRSRFLPVLALVLATTTRGSAVMADPPPKVCVAVAGDPDEAVRSAAETLATAIGSSPALRGVADADARAALRGERPTPDGMAELATARRALRTGTQDASVLDPIARQLGCALVLEVASRPVGTMLQVYDAVQHTWQEPHDVTTIDASLVDRWVVPAAHLEDRDAAVGGPAPPAVNTGGTAGPPGAMPAMRPGAVAPAPVPAVVAARPTFLSRAWPWLAAGGAVLGVLIVFVATQQQDPSSANVRLSVVHQGSP